MTLLEILNGLLTTHAAVGHPPHGDWEWIIWSTAHANPPMR